MPSFHLARVEPHPSFPARLPLSRRTLLAGSAAWCFAQSVGATTFAHKAQIAITLDLEMSAQYPTRDRVEWNYEKGNLDEATKKYAVEAARRVARLGGMIHFFCVGRVLEQPDVSWLKEIAELGHPIGNHTYDHVNVKAKKPEEAQFRFQRAPWLIQGRTAAELIRENIRVTTEALRSRVGVTVNGFRTPGGFNDALDDCPDVQQMLLDLGFSWVSSHYPPHPTGKPREEPSAAVYDGIVQAQTLAQPRRYASGLVEVPMSPISDVTAFRSNYWKRSYFLRAVRDAVMWAIEHGATFDFLAHPSCLVVEDPDFESIELICRLVREAGERAELVGLDKIAARVPAMAKNSPSQDGK